MRKPKRLGPDALLELAHEDTIFNDMGLLDPDEPTRYGHYLEQHRMWNRWCGDFTPQERMEIRMRFDMAALETEDR